MGFGFNRSGVLQNSGTTQTKLQGTLALGASAVELTTSEPSATSQILVLVSNSANGPLAGPKVDTITYDDGDGWCTASIANLVVSIVVDGTGLTEGEYVCHIPIIDSNASNSPQTIDVTMTVLPPAEVPVITLTPSALTFTGTDGGSDPATQTITVSNGGGSTFDTLAVGTITYGSGSGWLSATLGTDLATVTVAASLTGLSAGTYTATIPIEAANATTQNASVTLVVSAQQVPTISLSRGSLAFSANVGAGPTASQTITVSNTGSGSFSALAVGSVTYGSGSGWLTATLSGSTITVTAFPAQLTAGTYTATFPVTSSNANNSPQTVSVSFAVSAALPALIITSPSAVTFNATAGGSDPVSQTVAITNGGSSDFTSLAAGAVSYGSGSDWLAALLTSNTGSLTPGTGTTSSGSGAGPFTWTHTTVAGENVLFFAGGGYFGGGQSFSSVSFNGQALTLIKRSTGSTPRAELWGLVNPPIGAYQMSVTPNSSIGNPGRFDAISYSGYDTSVSMATLATLAASASGTSTGPSVTVASATGQKVLGVIVNGTNAAAPATLTWTDEVQRVNGAGSGVADMRVAMADEAGAASVTISGTLGSSQPWVALAVPLSVTGGSSASSTLTLAATTGALVAGTYTATVPITASNANNSPQNVSVTFTVGSGTPAQLVLSASSFAFNATVGGSNPSSQTATITNGGVGSFTGPTTGAVTYGSGSGWLTTKTVTGASVPYTLTVGVTTGALTAGTYTATFPVTDASANNSPQTVTVTFTVSSGAPPANYQPLSVTPPVFLTHDTSTDIASTNGSYWTSPNESTDFTGTVRTVTTRAEFLTAWNNSSATGGDVIEIASGATIDFATVVTLAAKTSGWTWIRPSGYASLPAEGTRIDPSLYSTTIATIRPTGTEPAIRLSGGHMGLYMTGIQVLKATSAGNSGASLLELSSLAQQSSGAVVGDVPQYVELRHCVVRNPWTAAGPFSNHGILMAAKYLKLRDSVVDGHGVSGTDAQALYFNHTPGFIEVHNNALEGSHENILSGGAVNNVGYTNAPIADVWFHQNYLYKRSAWLTGVLNNPVGLKNIYEMKAGTRWLVEGNVLDGHDGTGQPHDVNLGCKPQNQAETTTCQVKDLTFRLNLIKNGAAPLEIISAANDSGLFVQDGTQRVEIYNNLWTTPLFTSPTPTWLINAGHGMPNVKIHHNTFRALSSMFILDPNTPSGLAPNLYLCDNIDYGVAQFGPIFMGGGREDAAALDQLCGVGSWTAKNNVAVANQWDVTLGNATNNNKTAANQTAIGFTNTAAGDWSLASNSAYKGIGTGGSDPGVNFTRLSAITAGVIAGTPTGA